MSHTRDIGYPTTPWCVAVSALKSDTKCVKSDASSLKETAVQLCGFEGSNKAVFSIHLTINHEV